MENNLSKQIFNNSGKKKSVKILPTFLLVFFLVAVFISLNGCSRPAQTDINKPAQTEQNNDVKEAKIAFKSDAELIADYQNNRTEYQQIIRQIKEINELEAQLKKETDEIQRQLKINQEDNRNNENLRKSNEEKLNAEWKKIGDIFSKTYNKKYQQVNEAIKKIRNQAYDPYHVDSRKILDRSFKYDDTKKNTGYYVSEGYVLFDENTQPNPGLVVDNIDNFHDSGNIITTVEKIENKFAKYTPSNTIYLPIEGNFYLYFYIRHLS